MTRHRAALLLAAASIMACIATDASESRAEPSVAPPEVSDPHALHVHIELGGGSILKWSALDETGNTFGGLVLLRWRALELGLGAAVVLPDSRLQADFATLWVEGRYHLLGQPRPLALAPYLLAGLGVTLADEFEPLPTGFIPARWSRETNVAVHLGAGLRWGATSGMYAAAEVRALNHTHLGLQLLIGLAFP